MRAFILFAICCSIILSACTLTIPTGTSGGGSQPTPSNPNADAGLEEKQRNTGTDKLITELGMTPEQEIKYNRIISDHQSKVAGVQANQSLSDASRRTQIDELEKRKHTSIKAILTPQQSTKYDQLVNESTKRDPVVIPGRK
ncbi:MAG: hypothetical protein IPJ06_16170 [Saprospiraceae bacterium]|nr:hypothetical protein [Saprospiraceae bacterium]